MAGTPRVRAPEPRGRAWLNAAGDLSLRQLRGKLVLLDFWTFCCINCLHVLDELRPLEEKYADVLVVIGVHSPKFAHEADPAALAAAIQRYGVRHPVLDDPALETWQRYVVRAWPTLVLIDPEGYVVAHLSGEGHAHALDELLAELVVQHEANGTLRRGDGPYVPPPSPATELLFPGKLLALPDGSLLVSDTGHHSLVQLAADGETVLRRIGCGERGLRDGDATHARFSEPQGLALLPDEVREWLGYDVVVADTVNHALRGVRMATGEVLTVAGTGRQWMQGDPVPDGSSGAVPLSSPWDVAWYPAEMLVAVGMAGIHQVWGFDPVTPALEVLAGTTHEGLVDGPAAQAWLAQPSGVAAGSDGRLWFVDSETSSLRWLESRLVHTAVGQGLFAFGHRDGPGKEALLQHPLGLTLLPNGSVAVCDTYNGAIRRYDPAADQLATWATGLGEPSDALVMGDTLIVVESAAHRLTRLRLRDEALVLRGTTHRTHRPATRLRPGRIGLTVVFTPPTGQQLDDRHGPATRLVVSATPPEVLVEGAGAGTGLSRELVLDSRVDSVVLHVAAMAASCDDGSRVEFPACHVHQQDWGVPVELDASGDTSLTLYLAGRQ